MLRTNSMCLALVGVLGLAVPALAITFTSDATIASGDTTYDGQPVVVSGCTLTIDGTHTFASLRVINSGAVTHSQNGTTPAYVLDLSMAQDVFIEAGSRIDVSGRGYPAASGPAPGASGSYVAGGGGHAGRGTPSSEGHPGGGAYDIVKNPAEHGSGGGNVSWASGGAGGGCIILNIAGALTVDGTILAVGGDGQRAYDTQVAGGGAGGTIRIVAGQLAGAGTISAAGGHGGLCWNGTAGGGGGGRVSVRAATTTFTGSMMAHTYGGVVPSGAGTIYACFADQTLGTLQIDNRAALLGEITPCLASDAFDEVVVRGYGRLLLSGTTALTADVLRVETNGRMEVVGAVEFGDVQVAAGGAIASIAEDASFDLHAVGNIDVQAGGVISASGLGYPTSAGPGAGEDAEFYAAGGGHGGPGGAASTGAAGGEPYDSPTQPIQMGSGGGAHTSYYQPGGAGGGVLRIAADGAMIVNGSINADGADGQTAYGFSGSGGGAGGSIELRVGQLSGTGGITADGGAAPLEAGGGGGGRVVVYTCDWQIPPENVTVLGGPGWRAGGAGTVFHCSPYIQISRQPAGGIYFEREPLVLSVGAATSFGVLQYRWRKDGVDLNDDGHLAGTHTAVLTIAEPDSSVDSGQYEVRLEDDCAPYYSDSVFVLVPPLGDVNCDGAANVFDIDPFVQALTDPDGYQTSFPRCRTSQADCNLDGAVNVFDIDPFVVILTGA